MTRRDWLISDTIRRQRDFAVRDEDWVRVQHFEQLALSLGLTFKEDRADFDLPRFMEACGIKQVSRV